jgi:hypothetical protein
MNPTHIHQQGTILFPDEVKRLNTSARTQENWIYQYMKRHREPVTCEELQDEITPECPLTSVRRAMNYLCRRGVTEKCGKRMGLYGIMVYTYKLTYQ